MISRNNQHRTKLFFLHIPKTAGTSFVDSIKPWFSEDRRANYVEGISKEERTALDDRHFISGHIFFEEIQRLPYIVDYRLVSVFRDPYARLASHIRYMDRYNQPEYEAAFHHLGDDLKAIVKVIGKMDFQRSDDFEALFAGLTGWGRAAYENCQTRFLVCDLESTVASPYEDLPDGALDLALERLEAFDLIGISETLDTTIERLAALLDIPLTPNGSAPRSNTASSNRQIDHTDPRIREVMKPLLGLDEPLYARAKILFDRQTSAAA